jgi:quercetin dioxygenase-like cupin family protein
MEGHTYLRTHNLKSEYMLLDLGDVVTEMHGESGRAQTRGAVTLVKENGMSVVLTHLHSGARLEEHAAPGPATVQVLDGHASVQIGDEFVDVPAGRLVAFDAGVRHSVQAIEDTTLLLTLTGVSS